jgi:ABC-type Fe3+-hydroxamate transport system substrate-binding protein
MRTKTFYLAAMTGVFALISACGSNGSETENAVESHEHHHESKDPSEMQASSGRVFFANLSDGDTVSNPVAISFGVEGMQVKPAGSIEEGTGHHHLLIGSDSIATGEVVPANEKHIHYGGGQTNDTLDLPLGETKIALQFADGTHASYGSKMSASITVFVK